MNHLIEKHVLKNCIDFGSPNPNAILGKVLGENPELRKDIKKVMQEIAKSISEIKKLSKAQQVEMLNALAPELLEVRPVKEKKLSMPNVNDKPVLRFAPSPSGPLHIGHAYVLSLNSELAKIYNGKLILRIEDTNPENIYEAAYEMIPEDAIWLTNNNISEVVIQSDRLGTYYDHAEKLIDMGKAYVCTCDPDKFKQLLAKSRPCKCRNLNEQHTRYGKMFSSYKPGEAVLMLKTDLEHKNPAMRDFPLMRINDHVHPRQGKNHKVWPLMNFSVIIDDHLLGITHTLRGKEHMDNEKRQKYIADYFGWKMPEAIYVGKINFTDMHLKTSQTKKEILEGKYAGWDDIRLPFLRALRRRGYTPDAFAKYALDVGITENDKKVSKSEFFKTVNHFNKEIVDSHANRYFLVWNPAKVKIKGAPKIETSIHLHPDFHARGARKFKTDGKFLLVKDDLENLEEVKLHRLMDCLNFVKKGKELLFDSVDYDSFKNSKAKGRIIHWLPDEKLQTVKVLMDDGTLVEGKAEVGIKDLQPGMIVQFERFGFCRLDKHNEFWFMQR